LHLATHLGWDSQQINIKTAFLYGSLPDDETWFMYKPTSFEEPDKQDWVWKIIRSLYGMKQAGCIWNKTMYARMLDWGFTPLSSESCIYYHSAPSGTTLAAVHVDDFLTIASSQKDNDQFKAQMCEVWTISDSGVVKFVVGIAVEWDHPNCCVNLSQTALIDQIICQFGQADASPFTIPMTPGLKLRCSPHSSLSDTEWHALAKLPYHSLVGSLLYLAISSQPDITYTVQ
jgi:hypothetical protein